MGRRRLCVVKTEILGEAAKQTIFSAKYANSIPSPLSPLQSEFIHIYGDKLPGLRYFNFQG